MSYNLTGIIENQTSLFTIVQNINTELTFGWLGNLFFVSLYLIILTTFLRNTEDTMRSVAAANYIAFLLASIMVVLQLINPILFTLSLIAAAASMGVAWRQG